MIGMKERLCRKTPKQNYQQWDNRKERTPT